MEFRLFGEMQVWAAGRLLDVGAPRQQAVLAALVIDAGHPVPIETLVDRVWGEDPPEQARNVLYSHLSRIRQLVRQAGATGIPRLNSGYLLQVDPDAVDLHRFVRLAVQGRDARLPDAERSEALTEALRLWSGTPLAGVCGDWPDQVREVWGRRRLDAAVHWGEVELRLGRPEPVIDTISELVAVYPLAEPLEVLLIRALHETGRSAEAVDRYATVRKRLADQLGTEPGPRLQELHGEILRRERPSSSRPRPRSVPAQLPADTPGFAGREADLSRLDALLDGRSAATSVVVLSGTAGVGKSTLAVHWAHAASRHFPDGRLYVNLRGFDPAGSPVTAAEAMRGFLEALEVPQDRIPSSLEAQAGLYRSLLSGREVLVVLDNARDAGQVRPLLPGTPGCTVLVTSRDQLLGLAVAGAHLVEVGLFDDTESHAMLVARLGTGSVAAEPDAVREIIGLCARLPLALAVVAARAAGHPRFRLGALAAQLRDARGRLDEFASADSATDPRAVFSWSYLRLTPVAGRLFRLLGLHAGPEIGTPAAASLAALPAGKARPVLAELTRAHLVSEPSPGRYTCHDLLRAYAAELAESEETEAERELAVRRLLAHYSHTAYHADGFLGPRREVPPPLAPLPPGAEPEPMLRREQALAWFKAEHRNLVTAVHQDATFDGEVTDLVRWVQLFLEMQGHWHDELEVLSAALDAALRLGDGRKQAFALCQLGRTHIWFGRHTDAGRDLRAALELYRAVGDTVGQAYAHYSLAWLLDRQTAVDDALECAERALDLFRGAGHQAGQAKSLNAVGWFHTLLGRHQAALGYCREALALQEHLGDHLAAAQTLHSIGYIHAQLGDDDQAVAGYRAAAGLLHRHGYPVTEARILIELADLHHSRGDVASARAGWQRAQDVLTQLAHPEADAVRARLAHVHRRQSGADH
ncbi:AfsR/SARP family transcriptional regulator [Lentzea cavernae]|uniref:SARP family transcriptional regulator n=1 Tax=Lentzea cavernae TaxID=2020703 RepID=A0ABQ3MET1_9PSEU|nr:BTAD domain-containing putative transcriptional regulator [Lentzea cavernae]GHH42555.1 SARP family transcriptional regulator [Lentzea cavernae]